MRRQCLIIASMLLIFLTAFVVYHFVFYNQPKGPIASDATIDAIAANRIADYSISTRRVLRGSDGDFVVMTIQSVHVQKLRVVYNILYTDAVGNEQTESCYIDQIGLHAIHGDPSDDVTYHETRYRIAAKPGDKWKTFLPGFGTNTTEYICEGTEILNTPLGSIDTIKTRTELRQFGGSTLQLTYWYSQKYGLIQKRYGNRLLTLVERE